MNQIFKFLKIFRHESNKAAEGQRANQADCVHFLSSGISHAEFRSPPEV